MIYLQLITNAPIYVWFILIILITLGILHSQDREISLMRITILPIAMIIYALYSVIADFGLSPFSIIAWGVGMIIAIIVGVSLGLPKGVQYNKSSHHFLVKGSWLPLIIMLVIFINKYIIGVTKALSLPIMNNTWFIIVICVLYGIYSGIFLARALVIMRAKYAHNN